MRHHPTHLLFASLLTVCLLSLGTTNPVVAQSDGSSEPTTSTAEDKNGTSTGDEENSEDNTESEDDDAQDDDVPPAQDPERAQARQMAQAGLMSGGGGFLVREWALDVSLQGGFGGSQRGSVLMGRAMIGPMYITEPHALSFLGLADLQSYEGFSAGGAFQYLSLHTGLFWQAGAVVDLDGNPAFVGGVGYQILAFEYQRRNLGGDETNVFLGKLHIPITWLYRAFKPKK